MFWESFQFAHWEAISLFVYVIITETSIKTNDARLKIKPIITEIFCTGYNQLISKFAISEQTSLKASPLTIKQNKTKGWDVLSVDSSISDIDVSTLMIGFLLLAFGAVSTRAILSLHNGQSPWQSSIVRSTINNLFLTYQMNEKLLVLSIQEQISV